MFESEHLTLEATSDVRADTYDARAETAEEGPRGAAPDTPPVAAPAGPPNRRRAALLRALSSRDSLRQAILIHEVLGPPKGL